MVDVDNQKLTDKAMLKLKTEELISKAAELKQLNDSLSSANDALKLKTEELDNSNRALFETDQELASVNKELAAANKQFAETNKRFAEVNKELTSANKELVVVNHELALANEQIKSHHEMLTDFINIASHELRSPTQSILGYSELLQQFSEDEKGNDQKKKALQAIIRNANRLEKLATDILDVTRIDSNRLILHKELFNLNEKIKNVVDDVANQIIENTSNNSINHNNNNNNVKMIFESKGAKDIFVEADEKKIYQVISNLLTNAIKFTKEGTISITTDTTTNKGEIIVSISDTGSGISAHILPRLFSKFATDSSEGIGLGLYISKSIVEAHGGRIWAENNNLKGEKGATFTVSLPNVTN
jgi:signal transduction histidine kinase